MVGRNLKKYAKEKGLADVKITDRIYTPVWGREITYGRHLGEKLYSYQQAWDLAVDVLKDTPALKGIETW